MGNVSAMLMGATAKEGGEMNKIIAFRTYTPPPEPTLWRRGKNGTFEAS